MHAKSVHRVLCGIPNDEPMALEANLALYDRPLWTPYLYRPSGLLALAKENMIRNMEYKTMTADLFAVMSFRLLLEVCVENPESRSLARGAVYDSLSVVTSIHPVSRAIRTVTPSEPILAVAAMLHLFRSLDNWALSTCGMSESLLDAGLIEEGIKGELYARWLLTLGADVVRYPRFRSKELDEHQLDLSFTVGQFLMALYGANRREELEVIDHTCWLGKSTLRTL